MAFLSLNLYDTPGFAPRMSECFVLRVRRLSSKLLKQGYLVERLKSSYSESFMVDTGILFSNMKYPSHEC